MRFGFGFYVTWEVDIWKKFRNAKQSAIYHYFVSVEGCNFVIIVLVVEIVVFYYELMALDNQLDVIRTNIEIMQSSLEIVKLQKEVVKVIEFVV